MELLQKLTLYDLLGYTVPGSVLLVLWKQEDLQQLLEAGVTGVVLFIVMGFLMGIMISEFMFRIEKVIEKIFAKRQWKKICKKYAIGVARISRALKNARILSEVSEEDKIESYMQYYTAMYADIQVDPRYSRIHNYASAAFLYRNMILVAVFCIIVEAGRGLIEEAVVGAIGCICFGVRWWRFNRKEIGYAVCWFIEKYNEDIPSE